MSELDIFLAERATGIGREKWNAALGSNRAANNVQACERALGSDQEEWSDDFGAIEETEIPTPPGISADSDLILTDSTIYSADVAA